MSCRSRKHTVGHTPYVEEIIAFVAHRVIPDLGIGFPGITGKLVGSSVMHLFYHKKEMIAP